MANTYAKMREIKESIDSHTFSINYSKQFIEDKQIEMNSIKAKYNEIHS